MAGLPGDAFKKIIAEGESQTVEFKSRLPPNHIVAQVLAAFANTEGGILLVGVSDKGEILGLSDDEVEVTVDRLQKISSSLLPSPIQVGAIGMQGKNVVYALVDKAPIYYFPVMTSSGELYQRQLTKVVPVSPFHLQVPDIRMKIDSLGPAREVVVFVAMSFREEEDPALVDYFRAMERAVKATELPLTLKRIDLEEGDHEISQRIMEEIDKADIVIVDLTLNARNVYFELGYARGKDRRTIQTARKETVLEFDIRNWRTLFYRNATELEERLILELKAAYADVVR